MKRSIALLLALCLLTAGCGAKKAAEAGEAASAEETAADASEPDVNSGFTAAPATVTADDAPVRDLAAEEAEAAEEDLSSLTIDPPYDFDIDSMTAADFCEALSEEYPGSRSTYELLPGDAYSLEVTVISGEEEGPVIYVVAGVHGDEEAAWQAGKLLKGISLKAGTMYIIAPANRWGAEKVPMSRYLDSKDLNRAFPGNPNGTNAQRVAYAIYHDIEAKQPDFVLDLHEASIVSESRDYLGSSLIFTDVSLFSDLFYDLLWATEDGTICSRPFNYYAPGPEGSVNNTVTTGLGIPTLTVETFRGYQMEDRVSDQLDIVQYVLKYYEMI